MISSHFDTMVSALLPAGQFALFRREDLPRLPKASLDLLRAEADAALKEKPDFPALTETVEKPERGNVALAARRRRLSALVAGEAVTQNGEKGEYLREVVNGLYALCEEGSWNETARRAVPKRSAPPDTRAAQTAELVAWTALLLGSALDSLAPGLTARAFEECEERVLRYLDDPACCEAALRRPDAPVVARAYAMACLIVPQEESARWLRLKNALRIADRCVTGVWLERTFAKEGLAGWLLSACAIADMALLVDIACDGQSGLREDEELREAVRLPSLLHVSGEWFWDETSAMKPRLPAEDVYRLGAVFDDDSLCALGAHLLKGEAEYAPRFDGVASRMLSALWRDSLEKESAKLPVAERVEVPSMGLYAAKALGEGFSAALRCGSLNLFLDGQPILIDGPGGAASRSLPVPFGGWQVRQSVRDAQARIDGFPTLTMDIAPSYPAEARVASWQRTVMLTGGGSVARLLDAFDFSGARSACSLRFITPHRPVVAVGAPRARIGGAYLEWEGALEPSVETVELPEGASIWCGCLYALVLTQSAQVAGSCWTATFTRAK